MDAQINYFLPDAITKVTRDSNLCNVNPVENKSMFLKKVIDELGFASFKSQGLPDVVTSLSKLLKSNHRMYVLRDPHAEEFSDRLPFGYIKVGKKKLFLFDCYGEYYEVEPVCILDFYLSSQYQRKGYGKILFEHMLKEENLMEYELPIDTPSQKMLNFMRKHYNLMKPINQSNYFVVFQQFFHHVDKFLVNRRNCRKSKSSPFTNRVSSSAELRKYRKEQTSNYSTASVIPSSIPLPEPTDTIDDKLRTFPQLPLQAPGRTSLGVSSCDLDYLPLPEQVGKKASVSHRYLSREGLMSSSMPPHPSSRSLISNSDFRLHQKADYNYQTAVRSSYKHTRLW